RRRHTRCLSDWSSDVCSSDLRVIHVDVMDGHFVPPITMGPQMVQALSDHVHGAGGWLDVHLMIERPEQHVEAFAKAGADSINIRSEERRVGKEGRSRLEQ